MPLERVARLDEIPPGGRRLVSLAGKELGVFNCAGRFYALLSRCAHQGGPLCEGPIVPEVVAGQETDWEPFVRAETGILRCPWHGLEFEIATGRCLSNPRWRARSYPVHVEGDEVWVDIE